MRGDGDGWDVPALGACARMIDASEHRDPNRIDLHENPSQTRRMVKFSAPREAAGINFFTFAGTDPTALASIGGASRNPAGNRQLAGRRVGRGRSRREPAGVGGKLRADREWSGGRGARGSGRETTAARGWRQA